MTITGANGAPRTQASSLRIQVDAKFDEQAYPVGEDPVARCLLEVEVQPSWPGAGERVRADLVLVLDVSGSMDAPDRYPLLREAVSELIRQMPAEDRVGIVVFSSQAETVLPLTRVADARDQLARILERMDGSPQFGGGTNLAPGLEQALELFPAASDRARRVYVLTDGEIQDQPQALSVLPGLPVADAELHAYGFGASFSAASLKTLLAGQLGGSVKPICRHEDIVSTFGHNAQVTRRLVARDAVLTIDLDGEIACGDAWAFRPQERFLGQIVAHRLVRELGALEAGRRYAYLFEVRLPPEDAPQTAVCRVTLSCRDVAGDAQHSVLVTAPRCAARVSTARNAEVTRAYVVLDALRRPADRRAELDAARARRDLAIAEQREPGLIAALGRQIAILEGCAAPSSLGEEDTQYLDADQSTQA